MIDRSVLTRRSTNGRVSVRSRSPRRRRRRAARSGRRTAAGSWLAPPSRPGLANSMIDHRSASRFSTGVPVTAIRCARGQRADRLSPAVVAAFLMACASSSTTRRQGIARQRGGVPGGERVGRDDQVGRPRPPAERLAARPVRAVVDVHPQVGREPGRLALPVADQRHRADQQRRRGLGRASAPLSRASSASSWTVLPRPMSSARTAPSPSGRGTTARPARAPGTAAGSRRSRPAPRTGSSRRSPAPDSRSPSQPSASTLDHRQPTGPASSRVRRRASSSATLSRRRPRRPAPA